MPSEPEYGIISPEKLHDVIASRGVILDVRSHYEHDRKQLVAAHAHIPLDKLNPHDFIARQGLDAGAHIYLLCHGGVRAREAADEFILEGYPNVFVIDGGLRACEQQGHKLCGSVVTLHQKAVAALERHRMHRCPPPKP